MKRKEKEPFYFRFPPVAPEHLLLLFPFHTPSQALSHSVLQQLHISPHHQQR
jgi:hypothetical protein